MELLKRFIDAQVHFGHKTAKWNPHMQPYIWGAKNNIHIINISETEKSLDQAKKFLKGIAEQGRQILFVGTKKAAQKAIEEVAKKTGMPSVKQRWVGGTVTNFGNVKKSFARLLHMQDVVAKSSDFSYTKKELSTIQKNVERLQKNIGGIIGLKYPIGALVLVDIKKDQTALREARAAGVPVVAFVDTNDDPLLVGPNGVVIPTNNDSPKAIALILEELGAAVQEGVEIAKSKPVQTLESQEAETASEPFFMEEDDASAESAQGRAKKGAFKQPIRASKAPKRPIRSKPS